MEPFLGQIMMVGFNFAPRGWAFCHGQLIPISQNTALFSLLGTAYGGDGRTTFALPDLRDRCAIGMGQGIELSPRSQGEMSGTESVTLLQTQMPAHNHLMQASASTGNTNSPVNSVLAKTELQIDRSGPVYPINAYSNTLSEAAPMNSQTIGPAGETNPILICSLI